MIVHKRDIIANYIPCNKVVTLKHKIVALDGNIFSVGEKVIIQKTCSDSGCIFKIIGNSVTDSFNIYNYINTIHNDMYNTNHIIKYSNTYKYTKELKYFANAFFEVNDKCTEKYIKYLSHINLMTIIFIMITILLSIFSIIFTSAIGSKINLPTILTSIIAICGIAMTIILSKISCNGNSVKTLNYNLNYNDTQSIQKLLKTI